MDSISLTVTIVGSVAGIISIWLATEGLAKRAWGILALVFVGITFYYLASTLYASNNEMERVTSAARQASELVERKGELADDRGFVLASLSFLEAHKLDFPDTYARAKDLCETFKCLETTKVLSDRSLLSEAAHAMASLLSGIAIISQEGR